MNKCESKWYKNIHINSDSSTNICLDTRTNAEYDQNKLPIYMEINLTSNLNPPQLTHPDKFEIKKTKLTDLNTNNPKSNATKKKS